MTTLALEGICKDFGSVRAVSGASVSFEQGVLHAVVGENGAGKSTLLKIAAGVLTPDAGRVLVEGTALSPHTAREAILRGVAMVQQHFALVGVLTVLENLILGAEVTKGLFGRLDLGAARASATRSLAELGVELPLDARVEELGVGDRQRVEIARALMRDARVVILDEPTAVLTPAEATALYTTLRRLGDAGRAIVVVTHKLDEVTRHASRVTVLRKGEVVADEKLDPACRDEAAEQRRIATAIMGGEVPESPPAATATPGPPRLVLSRVSLGRAVQSVSFEVRSGEIVGIAGVEGNGQRELVRLLARLEQPTAGKISGGQEAVVVHEDRHSEGLVLDASVADNLLLGELGRHARRGILDARSMQAEARARADRFDVVPRDIEQVARALSGGNQQKIVVARALARHPTVLVMAHPTRGVDLGASRAIHAQIRRAAGEGAAVLVISADLSELRLLATRILVLSRGAIVAELPPSASDAEIGARMVGAAPPLARLRAGGAGSVGAHSP